MMPSLIFLTLLLYSRLGLKLYCFFEIDNRYSNSFFYFISNSFLLTFFFIKIHKSIVITIIIILTFV